MHTHTVELGTEIAVIRPVAFEHLAGLDALLDQLQVLWLKHQAALADLLLSDDSAIALDLMQKIANLHPRVDLRDQHGFDIAPLKDDLPQLESLFFFERDEESDNLTLAKGGAILRLNRFDPQKKYQAAVNRLVNPEPSDSTPSPSPAAATPTPTSSPT